VKFLICATMSPMSPTTRSCAANASATCAFYGHGKGGSGGVAEAGVSVVKAEAARAKVVVEPNFLIPARHHDADVANHKVMRCQCCCYKCFT
jgi:hypothetical protein